MTRDEHDIHDAHAADDLLGTARSDDGGICLCASATTVIPVMMSPEVLKSSSLPAAMRCQS